MERNSPTHFREKSRQNDFGGNSWKGRINYAIWIDIIDVLTPGYFFFSRDLKDHAKYCLLIIIAMFRGRIFLRVLKLVPTVSKQGSFGHFFYLVCWVISHSTHSQDSQQPSAKQSLCEGSVPIAWRATAATNTMNTILSPCRPDSHRVKPCLLTERALRGARRRYVNTTWQPRCRLRLLLRVPLRLCCSRLSFPLPLPRSVRAR